MRGPIGEAGVQVKAPPFSVSCDKGDKKRSLMAARSEACDEEMVDVDKRTKISTSVPSEDSLNQNSVAGVGELQPREHQ